MGVFYIRVSTGCSLYAGSIDKVHLWLVGEHGEASLGMLLAPQRNSVSFTELRLGWQGGGGVGGGGQGQRNPKEPCAGSLAPEGSHSPGKQSTCREALGERSAAVGGCLAGIVLSVSHFTELRWTTISSAGCRTSLFLEVGISHLLCRYWIFNLRVEWVGRRVWGAQYSVLSPVYMRLVLLSFSSYDSQILPDLDAVLCSLQRKIEK